MKRIWLWLVAVLGAYFVGRRQAEGGEARPPSRRPSRALDRVVALAGALAGMLDAWARLVPRRPRRLPRLGGRRLSGRLGGEAAVVRAGTPKMPVDPLTTAAATPAVGTPRKAEAQEIPPGGLARWWAYLRELFRRFSEDQVPAFAASLSFFGLLSLVPILLVVLAALGFLVQDPHRAVLEVQHLVQGLLPGASAKRAAADLIAQVKLEDQLHTLMRTRGITGIIGVASLVWAALQIFVNGATAMNAAWSVEETRGWLKLRVMALGLLIGAGALFLLSLLPSSGPDFVRQLHIPWLGLPEHVPWYVDLGFTLVAVALNIGMFTLIYRFLPNAPMTWRDALAGGAFAGVLWELAKQGFSLYLAHFGSYDKMYGSLGGVIILVIWVYYTSVVLLLGAEVAKLYSDAKEGRLRREHAKPPVGAKRQPAPSTV
jgi:membrane protein